MQLFIVEMEIGMRMQHGVTPSEIASAIIRMQLQLGKT